MAGERKGDTLKSRTGKALQLALAMGCLLGGLALEVEARDLAYSTYLGGSGMDTALDIAIDAEGNAWVVGTTSSADFPTTADALDRILNGYEIFLARFSPDGALLYSTFLGGSGDDVGLGVAFDAAGNIYVAGHTDSMDFPRVGGLPANLRGTDRRSLLSSRRLPAPASSIRPRSAAAGGTSHGGSRWIPRVPPMLLARRIPEISPWSAASRRRSEAARRTPSSRS